MSSIKLSELYGQEDKLTKSQMDNIIFDGIRDNGECAEYAVVFGNPEYQGYRINEAIKLYKAKRVKKLILTGGVGRNTEYLKRKEIEAEQIKK